MDSNQSTNVNRIVMLPTKKWAAGAAAMLLGASLVISACSDSSAPVVQATAVPTMAAAETPVTTEATPTVETSGAVNGTEEMTGTEDVTGGETLTDTEGVTGSEEMTDTEGVTGGATMTDTGDMTDTGSMTDTGGMDNTGGMTETGTMSETGAVNTAGTLPLMGVTGVGEHQYVRASTLLDYDFENLNNEVSGDLEDLLINLDTGRVLFASIEYGGVLDLGDKDIVVPLNAFTIGADGQLVLNIDEAALESYPDVGNDWPDLTNPTWDDDVNTYWTETGIDIGPGFDEATNDVVWASDMMGENVADLGNGAGSVLDILVNLGTGYANYVIVDYGEGLDTDPYIIPITAFNVTNRNEGLTYGPDFSVDMLTDAPRFDAETYPEGTALDEDFGDRIEAWWNNMGFSNDLNNDGEIDH